jgi:amino acid adenylation domain-containing protein
MVLLSAFAVLLSRYSGQEDIVVGTPITNRFSELFESTIGCFVNLLPLRMNVNPEETFFDFLGETRNVCFDAYRYQEVPFERLVEELQPDRNPAVPPIFQVILTMHNAPQGESVFGGLKVEDIEPRESSVRYDMALHVMERSDHLQLVCHYNRDLFREWRMQQFLQEYIVVLETIAREPRRKIADIPLMHDDERHAMLALSRGHHVAPAFTTIHKLFERQVDMTPNATALVADGRRFSYGELDRLSNVIATILIAQGVSCEDVLGLAIHRNAELIICVLGVLKAGAAYLPLDPRLPEARLKLMIEDATCKVILADSRAHSLLPPNTRVVTVRLRDLEVQLRTETITRPSRTASRANAAYVLYTSGSSGIPKAVVVEHRQVLNYLAGVENAVHFAKETNYAMLQPLSVDSSVTMLFVSLTSGGCLHLLDEDIAIDALRLSDYFRAENIGCLKIAPSHLTALQGERQWRSLIPDVLIVGGEESRAAWLSEIADKAPRCSVWNHYGPTETTVGVLMCSFREVEHEAADTAPLGRPLVNTEAYVLDASLQLAPLGVAGELYIAGESLGRGYLRKSALTAERFVANPFRTDGSRMYRTGDLVRWREDKHLEFLGRADNQVKIRGFRIELREIESVLLAQSAVREAVVVAQKEPTFGAQLVGYVVSHVGERIDPSQVRNKLSEYLPDYMVPSLIIVLDALPRTNHGKLDRNSLPKASFANERLIRAPQTEEEKVLCALFSEVLRLDQVGVDDNFFQLGGHSLMATRIVNRIRSELGVELRLRDVFYAQSIQSLALAVTVLRTENRSSVDRNTSMAHEERYI